MNLADRNILILGHAKYDSTGESTSFTVAKYLARTNNVFYAEHPFTWRDYFKFKGKPQFIRRAAYFFNSKKVIDTPIPRLKVIITPPVLSINFLPEGKFYRLFLKINEWIVASRLKKISKTFNLADIIYLNVFNFHFPELAKSIKTSLNVYYCVDPMITPYDIRHGFISEEKLVRNSKLVICTSRQLYEEKSQQNPETYFIPNGADINHSSKALDVGLTVHPAVSGLKKPIIGYFGSIERRMDFEILKEIIALNPDKSFVFAGPVSEGFLPDWIKSEANVYFTGRIPFEEMPSMLKGFDLAIIPFKKDTVSRTIFPLKLFEYLGAGKSVICTDFNPDLAEFTDGTVEFCDTAQSFSDAIEKCLLQGPTEMKKRMEVAAENTWDERIKEITNLLEKFINK